MFDNALKILLITNSLVLVAGAMLGPIYAIFVERIGGDLMEAGIAGAIFALVAGLTTLWVGKISDKIRENELIVVVDYFIMGAAFLYYIFIDTVITAFHSSGHHMVR